MSQNERPRIALLVPPARIPSMFTEEALARLGQLGQVVRADGTTDEIAGDLPELLQNADVAVTGWGAPPIPAELFGSRLKLVAHAAGSVKRLVPDEVVHKGVAVSHAANIIADAVCEYALCLILMGLRRPQEMDAALRSGTRWREGAIGQIQPRLLSGRPVGVVGAGYVGRKVTRLLHGFDARVSIYDPYLTDERASELGVRRVELDALFAENDVITLHAPITPETKHMIGARQLGLIHDGAVFVNVARSWLVDQDALLAELRKNRFWAALDVFDDEPLPVDSPFRSLPNTVISPHEAGHSIDSYARQGMAMVEEVERFLRGEPLQHQIRPDQFSLMA